MFVTKKKHEKLENKLDELEKNLQRYRDDYYKLSNDCFEYRTTLQNILIRDLEKKYDVKIWLGFLGGHRFTYEISCIKNKQELFRYQYPSKELFTYIKDMIEGEIQIKLYGIHCNKEKP